MVIIAGQSCDPIVLHRFMQYFYNRGYTLHIYDPPQIPGQLENKARIYRDVSGLSTDVPAVYMLCAQTFHSDEELRRWILKMARPGFASINCTLTPSIFSQMNQVPTTHNQKVQAIKQNYPRIVALDFRLFDVKYMHTLYLGAADESATTTGRMRDNANDSVICTFEAYVADLGKLQLMIAELISSFRHSLLVDLIGGGNAN
jgi:hypothetical protein